LDERAVRLDRTRHCADPEPRGKRDQGVAHDRADARSNTAPEPTFYGALNAEHVDRTDWLRDANAVEQSERNDKRVWNIVQQDGRCSVSESCAHRRTAGARFADFTRDRETTEMRALPQGSFTKLRRRRKSFTSTSLLWVLVVAAVSLVHVLQAK